MNYKQLSLEQLQELLWLREFHKVSLAGLCRQFNLGMYRLKGILSEHGMWEVTAKQQQIAELKMVQELKNKKVKKYADYLKEKEIDLRKWKQAQ